MWLSQPPPRLLLKCSSIWDLHGRRHSPLAITTQAACDADHDTPCVLCSLAEDVNQLAAAFAACMSKISFLDSTLPPIPGGVLSGVTFELVAYANKQGIARELGTDAWSEERVGVENDDGRDRSTNYGADRSMNSEKQMEFPANAGGKQTYPVKTTKTNLIDIDVFVERKKSN